MTEREEDISLLRFAVEAVPSGILAVDDRGVILLVNREIERLFGYRREDLIGRPVEILIPEAARASHPKLRSQYLEHPGARPMGAGRELFGRRSDGTQVPLEVGLNPVETERGTIVLASVVDIRARRALEDQVRQSQKLEAIGTLAGGIAHDFNNLLLAIVGYTQLAHRRASEDSKQRADLDHVLAAAERGRQLVRRILAFSRRHDAVRTAIPLERPVREALQLLRASLPATVEMRDHLDAEAPMVSADEIEIHQILMNLATNAAHAMDAAGGVLEVGLSPLVLDDSAAEARGLGPGRYARLVVSDNGRGMPPEVRERAFEPFFTTKPPGEGTGLGLSVIHGIVKSCEGAIDITSQPGRGTTVEILLPAAEPIERATTGTRSRPPSQGGRRILLVDDEELLAELVRRQLEAAGYRVTKHTSSPEALEAFRADPRAFDLVITDNTMPRMTGLVLAQEVRKLRPDQRILMVSGIGERLQPDALLKMGILRVLPKPHTFLELEEAVRAALAAPAP